MATCFGIDIYILSRWKGKQKSTQGLLDTGKTMLTIKDGKDWKTADVNLVEARMRQKLVADDAKSEA